MNREKMSEPADIRTALGTHSDARTVGEDDVAP